MVTKGKDIPAMMLLYDSSRKFAFSLEVVILGNRRRHSLLHVLPSKKRTCHGGLWLLSVRLVALL